MNKIFAGIIGLGVGIKHFETISGIKNCEVKYVCDFNKKKLLKFKTDRKVKKIINYKEMLNDNSINLVVIASYDNFHYDQIVECIKFKKNIFIEKPICLTNHELFKLRILLKKNPNIKISSNLVLRTNKIFQNVKKQINKNNFGKTYYFEGDYNFGRIEKIQSGWRGKISNYSVVLGGGIHLIDIILWLNNSKVKKVLALGNNISTKNSQFKKNDFVTALIKFSDNSIAKISSNFGSCAPHHHILNIYGTKKTFMHNLRENVFYSSRNPEKKEYSVDNKKFYNNKKIILESFIKSFYSKKQPMVTKKDVFISMAVGLAIEKSVKNSKWVNIKNI